MDALTLNWPGGEHEFALRLGELRKMQEACDAGPEEILTRLSTGTWRVNDILEPIRLGLIGSGAKETRDAGPLVSSLMEQHPIIQFRFTALAVLTHALLGPEDDQPGEAEGVETPAPKNGGSASSTGTARSSGGRRRKSTK